MASFSPPPSPPGTEALGVQISLPGSRACTFGTSQSQRRRLPLLARGQLEGPPEARRACSYLWRLAHRPGGEWMPFHFAWGLRLFRSGWRWLAVRPGSEWVLVGPHWGWADSCPAAGQRLRGWSLGWRWVRWEWLTTGTASGSSGGLPCKMWDLVGQALLDYPPVVIAPYANPSGEVAKAREVSSGDLSKQFSHVGHKLEWR